MYTFNIEPLHNENIVTNTYSNTDKKIVGGGDKFKVYKASDFVRIVVNDSTKMKNLCEFFFAYIVYDTLIYAKGKMYYALQKKMLEIEGFIIKKLLENVSEGTQIKLQYSSNNISDFSEYIFTLFSVTSSDSAVQSVDIIKNSWEDISSKINLSQGQYLHHLDSVYKKYEGIYHNEKDDHKLKQILDLRDHSAGIGMGGPKYSFHQKVELKYTQLESIKSSNFFYKTEHFYIQDKNMLKSRFTNEEAIKTLLLEHGIEKLIHIYYTYLSIKDLKELYEFRINIRKAIAHFMCYNNFDIVNLLIFQDILFYKIIKNGASIIYNTDGRADPVSKPLLRDTLKVEDNTRDDNINEQFLKHQLFYRYKELEKALRRYYLPHVVFEISMREEKPHSAIDIIQIRQTTLEDDVCLLDTAGEIIIDRMKSVTTFYKPEPEPDSTSYQPCQLVKFIYHDTNDSSSVGSHEEKALDIYSIGRISSVDYENKTCVIELFAQITDNNAFDTTIDELSLQSNSIQSKEEGLSTTFNSLFTVPSKPFVGTITFDLIYDTSLLYGRLSSTQCSFTKTFKIKYRDFDLFSPEFDRPVTYVSLVYKIDQNDKTDDKVLFIIPESVQNSRPELKPLGDGADEPVEPKYAYITFSIVDNNNSEKQLKLNTCNTITECDIAGIFDKNTSLSDIYSESSTHCILIEEVKGDNYVKRAFDDNEHLDKLYFSSQEIKLQ